MTPTGVDIYDNQRTHLSICMIVVRLAMAKPKKASMKEKLAALRAKATQATDPFWGAEEDEWITVDVDIDSIAVDEDESDAWKTTTTINCRIDGEEYMDLEIPFWAVDSMFAALEDADVDDAGEATLKFRRSKDGKKNEGKWK